MAHRRHLLAAALALPAAWPARVLAAPDRLRIADAFSNEAVLPRKVHLADLSVWRPPV
ncbi:hypothetical protein [Azohydromonas caseinilytica]|uniref:Uncharacterized protein n=1 Tax=Azohydromonas caseinilytica TaxID=2728836 RepID=A0A848F8I2_9BURK|nr:hypothetical protein [Azohydromonas caseinilytica]NML16447.1 hypothetical protein [Azohydromonas caseinilytica]